MNEENQANNNPAQPQSTEQKIKEAKLSRDPAVNEGINRTVDAIIGLAATKISDEKERQLVQGDVADILRDSLHEIVEERSESQLQSRITQQITRSAQTQSIGDAAQAGIEVAKQVQNLGFVEFTAGLINGTFDAITGATIKQMQAYSELVANLAKTLKQFEAENISEAQVTAYLIERYPQPEDNSKTVVSPTYTFSAVAQNNTNGTAAKSANEQLKEVADALVAETLNLEQPLNIVIADNQNNFSVNQVIVIRRKLSESLAQSMINHLREMAREGMARIVITDGEILSKLTFQVTSTEADRKAKSEYERTQKSAYIRARAGWGWGRASVGGSYSKLNVKAVNESSFDSLTMSTEIIGQVKLRFRTETFSPVEGN
ncbi:MAG: hypothetical protein F6K36_23485 [Symploca sp. SIO3C6]|uniref:Uncharacterized protein n=1 Tax=Symploca sp. SIO1C4 TaxID=2607765 RepID=A0A6B3NEU1_9CYAN|nr:hypothetical protein [Symploca sp. SIO3C6]NER30143.1 hypothetical protein [Symploca sp. SIO1C4]